MNRAEGAKFWLYNVIIAGYVVVARGIFGCWIRILLGYVLDVIRGVLARQVDHRLCT